MEPLLDKVPAITPEKIQSTRPMPWQDTAQQECANYGSVMGKLSLMLRKAVCTP
ncbi:hypothetical protein [Cognatiyoonia sp. IB215182]|uniref:hypothetical protein n=1 Tax=Cognatiyoonia sp. IB215182 TaxID=3097353 RepID=UPI002A0E7F0B|nr:hypothetical protein [Cognatiyoonia sp. IB215182]MDX8354629.1 hypothetical protein [Cognatiyoonia sp. IB215182]